MRGATPPPPIRWCIQKFPDWAVNEIITISIRWEETQRVMAAKVTRLTHKIAIQLHLVTESFTIYSSRSRRPVRKLLDTPSYAIMARCSVKAEGHLYLLHTGLSDLFIFRINSVTTNPFHVLLDLLWRWLVHRKVPTYTGRQNQEARTDFKYQAGFKHMIKIFRRFNTERNYDRAATKVTFSLCLTKHHAMKTY
jgi:hypothetical protein